MRGVRLQLSRCRKCVRMDGLHTHLLMRGCCRHDPWFCTPCVPAPPPNIPCRYFLAPQKREDGESVDAFASRVQDMIAKQVGWSSCQAQQQHQQQHAVGAVVSTGVRPMQDWTLHSKGGPSWMGVGA